MIITPNRGLNQRGLPVEEGVFLVKGAYGSPQLKEINVRQHSHMGLCCDGRDYSMVRDDSIPSQDSVVYTDYSVPVGWTSLTFISRVRDLPQ